MAKKKAKKAGQKAKKAKPKAKKTKVRVKAKAKVKAPALPKEKVLGRIEHYFDKISVAAISVKSPFKVGDVIHIKGHTTDFYQRVDSIQIEHESVAKVKKGDDIGIKVKEFTREHDLVYLGKEKDLAAKPAGEKKQFTQTSIFEKPSPAVKPEAKSEAKPAAAPAPYSNTRFVKF